MELSPALNFDVVIPAAGASSRMGSWKLLLPWKGTTVIQTVVATALEVCPREGSARVILVTGYRGDELAALFAGEPRVICVAHRGWQAGMASTIAAGAVRVQTPWFFVALADMPLLTAGLYRDVAQAAIPHFELIRPVFGGEPGHPVLFHSSVVGRLQAWTATAGHPESLRDLVATMRVRQLEVDDAGCVKDFDRPEEYEAALAAGQN